MCVRGGAQSASLVKVGLTDLPKLGWAIAHPTHTSPTPRPIVTHSMAIVNLNKIEDFMINRNTTTG